MFQQVSNTIMLITYPDSLGNNLHDLSFVLKTHLKEAVGGLHILPFFPSSADRGFAPTTYKEVDKKFGTWDEIMDLGKSYYMMYDYMINHISSSSKIYQDFLNKKDKSKYYDFFIRYQKFWKDGNPTDEEMARLYKRKIPPYIDVRFNDGTTERIWTTFSDYQIDMNQKSKVVQEFTRNNLIFLAEHGASIIRLDAVGYAAKRPGTNCFFVEPEIWNILDKCQEYLTNYHADILPEIHENYFLQKKVEEEGYYTYDFQLPMLLLNALYFGRSAYLKNWLKVCPRKQFTTLDTHDGIGVVDARYLLPDKELLATKKKVFEINPDITELYKESHTPIQFDCFDTYQINCTYYSALGEDDTKYFIARAVQFFTPGIPQVYYVGLFAGKNDFELYHKTLISRDINRHTYTLKEIQDVCEQPFVQKLIRLMILRNHHAAFNGQFQLLNSDVHSLHMRWENGVDFADLSTNFSTFEYSITYSEKGRTKKFC
jgi:sucrose phosphorylase